MVFKGQTLIPYQGSEPYIFLSYSHKDTDEASQIVGQMMHNRFRIWYDEGVIPGTQWDENIAVKVVNCSFFIALVSRAYVRSSNCLDELNYARDKEKSILLIYLEDASLPAGMEMRLGRLLAVHKHSYDSLTAFYKKVCSAKGISACRELSIEELVDRKTAPPVRPSQGKSAGTAARKGSAASAPKQRQIAEPPHAEERRNSLPVILLILFLLLAAAAVFALIQSSSLSGTQAELPSRPPEPVVSLAPEETSAIVEVSPVVESTSGQETESDAEESASGDSSDISESPAAEQTIYPSEPSPTDTVLVETAPEGSETPEAVEDSGDTEDVAVVTGSSGASETDPGSTETAADAVSAGSEQSQSAGGSSGTEVTVSAAQ
ncbi:MAG: TIR domain-containing protein [Oscillospiraceae bacterium]|nr:TIR domain-containing protein [Oscillospiraceae bacterium]